MDLTNVASILELSTKYGSTVTLIVLFSYLIYTFHIKNDNDFNLVDLFVDKTSNRIDDSKFRLNVAFIVTAWALMYLTLNDKLTEWYVTAFLTAWVVDRKFARESKIQASLVKEQ